MAGVVAMASGIEDFESQPCKKPRKDGGSPVVKTITNYFSPVPKPAEKPFSPPRSNNIMDYFSRKNPSSTEKTVTPEQSKENRQRPVSVEKPTAQVEQVKKPVKPSQKQGRKRSKASRRLQVPEAVDSSEENNCLVIQDSEESRGDGLDSVSTCGILGSDTAALLAQFSAEACTGDTSSRPEKNSQSVGIEKLKKDEQHEHSQSKDHVKLKSTKSNCNGMSPVAPLKDTLKTAKHTVTKGSKKHQPEDPPPEEVEEVTETEQSLCNVSMEVNMGDASQLNSSTVTISFEDFLQSQCQGEDGKEDKGGEESGGLPEEMEQGVCNVDAQEGSGTPPPLQQVSPRTLTIHAEVHAVSPKHKPVKPAGKMASMFCSKKGSASPAQVESSPVQSNDEPPAGAPTVKRKSNVVLLEEDLELAEVDSQSTATAKCSQAERKQFMSAFKQPGLDGAKAKPGKGQSKQKQPAGESTGAVEKEDDEGVTSVPSVEHLPVAGPGKKGVKNKALKKGKRRRQKDEEMDPASPVVCTEPTALNEQADVDDKATEPASPSAPSSEAVRRSRRSRREACLREAPAEAETSTTSPARKTRSKERAKDAASFQDSPVQMSTPKTPKSRFKAEMVCPADDRGSPIRMKFTRVHRNKSASEGGSDRDITSPLATKTSEASKRRKQAKKLVEKAKAVQQGKQSTVQDTSTLRRSSRAQVSTKKISYDEDENSIICMEDDSTPKITPEKSKSQKRMRSLNDVLGKPAPVSKDAKPATGSKVAPLFQGKKAPKASAPVVSIFDENSHEGSENSQDNEQFRARREFLKSGLPESFKKQMAVATATKEAYSLSCSYFQPVVHVLQPPDDCPAWNLVWPESSLLRHLKELWCLLVPHPPLPPLTPLSPCRKTEPAARAALCQRDPAWRKEFSECVRRVLMEEVRASNPPFPVQTFFTRFLKRHSDHLLQHCTASEVAVASVAPAPAQTKGGKRKRLNEEETMGKEAKKKRRSSRGEVVMEVEVVEEQQQASAPETPRPCKRTGRMSRVQRLQMEDKEEEEEEDEKPSTPLSSLDDSVIVLDSSPVAQSAGKEASVKDDVLWTEKYHPQHSSEIIGNTASVRRLHSWLKEWKLRADREERKKQKDKKQEESSNDSDWDGGEEGEDMMMCNTLLITGPTGVGKTAAVYACAQELGFKVFEVNSSSQRSGRLILSQLKEATQSHQVDIQGSSAYRPTYFNSYGTSSVPARPGSSPRKVNSPRRVVSSPRKAPQSPRGARRGHLAPTSLANFFKVGQTVSKEPANTEKTKKTVPPKKAIKEKETASKSKELAVKPPVSTIAKLMGSAKATPTEEQSKKTTATSLILFEEVDVIFDDDTGFLAAIKTFMSTTKRPVILTTSDPNFSTMFDGFLEEIHFKAPSVVNVGSYLQLLCLTEGVRTDPQDVRNLLTLNGCDVRQSLLQLQFWTRSTGGRHITNTTMTTDTKHGESDTVAAVKAEDGALEAAVSTPLPPCESGCTESMLGLLNIQPDPDIQQLLKSQCSDEASLCCELLMDSKRRTVDLLRSNMETLLPLPLSQLAPRAQGPQQPSSTAHGQASVEPQELDPPLSHARLLQQATESSDDLDDASPVKVSNRMKNKRQQHCLEKQDALDSDSDSEDDFLSLRRKPQSPPQTEQSREDTEAAVPDVRVPQSPPVKRVPLTPDQKRKAVPISRCLGSMAEFLDDMSYLDSCLTCHTLEGIQSHRRMLGLPACSEVKAGLTDEPRVENDCWVEGEQALEVQAAVEALSFRRCQRGVAEAWRDAQQLDGELGKEAAAELTLPVAPHREAFRLTQDSPGQPNKLQKRRELMECLLSRGAFGTLGNRPAAAVEYLPILRTICRSEQQKEQDKVKRRFLHYLDGIHLGLPKSTVQLLAEDFP